MIGMRNTILARSKRLQPRCLSYIAPKSIAAEAASYERTTWRLVACAVLASLSRERVMDNELMKAGAVVTVTPVLLLFLALQGYYIEGLLLGGVKG